MPVMSPRPRGIFLSYRREDTAPVARLLGLKLSERFPDAQIFMDLDSIEAGEDFAEHILEAVDSSAVLVALIGSQWATLADEQGRPRLDNRDDPVRFEVQAALERGVRVIPVLVDGSRPLRRAQLPDELHKLARLNALELSYSRYEFDTDRLVDIIRQVLPEGPDDGLAEGPIALRGRGQEVWTKQQTADPTKRDAYAVTASVTAAHAEREAQVQASEPRFGRPKIFVCYRREDTQGFAGRIYDNLVGKYGHEQVFRDVGSIPAGIKYSTLIESRVSQCSVMIVLIGKTWLSARDRAGQRRLDSPKDWVRREIEMALQRDIPIIPVRVEGAPMPSEDELPPSIADLTEFESAEVTDSRWASDVEKVIKDINNLIVSK